jgi:hypothetical protein
MPCFHHIIFISLGLKYYLVEKIERLESCVWCVGWLEERIAQGER